MISGIIEQLQKDAQNASGFRVGQKVYVLPDYEFGARQPAQARTVTSIGYDISSGRVQVMAGRFYYSLLFATKAEAEEVRKKKFIKVLKSGIKQHKQQIAKERKYILEIEKELREITD